ADGDALSYSWDFGDGVTATGATASHTYADDGSYTVTLTVSDGFGGVAHDTLTVTVLNVAPTVSFQGPARVSHTRAAAFTGSFTYPGADIGTATVDYGDGGGPQALALNPDHTFSFQHLFAVPGNYTVVVVVQDDDGGQGSFTQTLTVTNAAPDADA